MRPIQNARHGVDKPVLGLVRLGTAVALLMMLLGSAAHAWELPQQSRATSVPQPLVPGDEHWLRGFNAPGMNASVAALAVSPDGSVYAGG